MPADCSTATATPPDNPVTSSDPSGLMPCDGEGTSDCWVQGTPPPATPPYASGYTPPPPPIWTAPSPGMIERTVTSRPQTAPDVRTQPAPTYDAFDCVHLGTDCGGFNRATAIPKSSSFNP